MKIDMEEVATTELEKLLSVPLESMGLKVLDMPDFGMLLSFLPWENRRKVSVSMIKSVIMGGEEKKVKDVNQLEQLFVILSPLLRDEGMSAPTMYDASLDHGGGGGGLISRTANLMGTLGISPSPQRDDLFGGQNNNSSMMAGGGFGQSQSFGGDTTKLGQFREEQQLVAKLVHVLDNEDTDLAYQMLNVARKHMLAGGAARVGTTLPPVVFAALGLLRRVQALEFPDPLPVVAKKEELKVVEDVKEEETKETPDSDAVEETKEESSGESKDESNDKEDGEETTRESAVAEDEAEGKEDETTSAAATEDAKEEKDDMEPKESAPTAEEVKEGKIETESNTLAVAEEEPKQLFPEFTKSVVCRKILVFLQKTVAMLASTNPELAFKLYLETAVATDLLANTTKIHHPNSSSEFCSISYDFMTQAFLVYEDEISESNAQIRAITAIVGSLLSCKTFEKTDYEALITKTAQYAAKLLKKPDQCRMVCLVSRLFYVGGKDDVNAYRNPQRVLECLQRGLKIADACSMASSSNVQLFVEILDYYVYYYEIENPVITDKFLSGLIALINEHFDSIGVLPSPAIVETRAYYGQILDQIRRKKAEENTKERFVLIVC